jgi:hypothetical protein
MMLWTFAIYVPYPSKLESKLPYFIEVVPHLKPNDGGGPEAVHIMMK